MELWTREQALDKTTKTRASRIERESDSPRIQQLVRVIRNPEQSRIYPYGEAREWYGIKADRSQPKGNKKGQGKTEERERTIVQRTPQRGQKLVNKERELARSGRLESRSRSSLACSLPGTSPRRRRRLGRRLAGVRVVWKIQRNSESIWSRSSWPGTEAIRSQEEARAGEWGWSADNEEETTMVRVGDCRER